MRPFDREQEATAVDALLRALDIVGAKRGLELQTTLVCAKARSAFSWASAPTAARRFLWAGANRDAEQKPVRTEVAVEIFVGGAAELTRIGHTHSVAPRELAVQARGDPDGYSDDELSLADAFARAAPRVRSAAAQHGVLAVGRLLRGSAALRRVLLVLVARTQSRSGPVTLRLPARSVPSSISSGLISTVKGPPFCADNRGMRRHPNTDSTGAPSLTITIRMRKRTAVVLAGVTVLAAAALAAAAWVTSTSGNGYSKAATASPLTLSDASASTTGQLYPGGSGDLKLKVSNPNSFPVRITAVSLTSGGTITSDTSGCTALNDAVTFTNQTGLTLDLAGNASGTVFTLANAVQMGSTSANACQGAVFTIPIDVTAASN